MTRTDQPDTRIRPARPDERAALIALQRAAALMWKEDRAALLADPDAIDIPADQITEGHVFVGEVDGAVAGFVVVLPRDDGAAELDGLYVDPAHWHGGVGRRLVDHAVAVARERGCTALNVIANKHATGFYSACGFQVTGEAQTPINVAWSMVKTL